MHYLLNSICNSIFACNISKANLTKNNQSEGKHMCITIKKCWILNFLKEFSYAYLFFIYLIKYTVKQ